MNVLRCICICIWLSLYLLSMKAARADLIDYGFNFTNAAAAQADAKMLAGQFGVANGWAQDHVIAGIQCWRPSKDVGGVHTFLPGYYVLVSIDTPSPVAALLSDSALAFALDRTARENGRPFVVQNNIGAIISDLGRQPMFASRSPYPVGGYQ